MRAAVAAFALIAALLLQGCGDEDDVGIEGVRPSEDGTLEVLHGNFAFAPGDLLFEVGETVEFKLQSADDVHTFTVRDLDIDWVVTKEAEAQVQTFTFDQPGTYGLICAIPGHRANGMEGTIEVR